MNVIRSLDFPRLVAACAAIVILGLSVLLWRSSNIQGLPATVFLAPAQASFGTVKDQPTVEADAELVNNTDHAVNVTDTRLSCGCSRIELAAVEIPPQGRSKVHLTVNLKGKHGKQFFEATIFTDEPGLPALRFLLTGDVMVSALGELPYDLGSFRPGEAVDKVVHLAKNGFGAGRLRAAHLEGNVALRAKIDDAPSEDDYRVRITGEAPREAGMFGAVLRLRASDGGWSEAVLRLRAEVVSGWKAPADIYVGFVPPGGAASKEVELTESGRPTPTRDVRIDASCNTEGIAAICRPLSPGVAKLLVEARHTGVAGGRDGVIELNVKGAKADAEQTIRIPVHVYYE